MIDHRAKTMEDGLSDRLVHHLTRGIEGYFYVVSDVSLQRYDGEAFSDIDGGVLLNNKISPSEIKDIYSHKEGIILNCGLSSAIYYLPKGSLKVESIALPFEAETQVDGDNILLLQPKASSTKIFRISSCHETVGSNPLVVFPDVIEQVAVLANEVFATSKSGKVYVNDSKRKFDISGKLLHRSEDILLCNSEKVYQWNGEGFDVLKELNLGFGLKCIVAKVDSFDNIILATSYSERFINKLIAIDKNNEVVYLNQILEHTTIFKDLYCEDIFDEVITVGYDNVNYFRFLRPGTSMHFQKKDKELTFGYVITGIASDQRGKTVFLSESGVMGILDQDSSGLQLRYEGSELFNNSQKIYHSAYSDIYYSHTYDFEHASVLYIADIKNDNIKTKEFQLNIEDIYEISDTTILVAGVNNRGQGQLLVYNLNQDTSQLVFSFEHSIKSIQYRKEVDQYWIGTVRGLLVLDRDFKEITRFSRDSGDEPQIMPSDHVRMTCDYLGYVVVGTIGGGIYIIDPEEFTIIKNIGLKEGLSNSKAVALTPDNDGNLWVGTWRGLNVIDSSLRVFNKYYVHDGLTHNEFNTKAVSKNSKGTLFFGTLDGMVEIHPRVLLNRKESFGMVIKDIKSYKNNDISLLDSLYFKSSADSVVITIAHPDYFTYHTGSVINYDVDYDQDAFMRHISKGKNKLTLYPSAVKDSELTVHNNKSSYTLTERIIEQKDWSTFYKVAGLLLILALLSSLGVLYLKNIEQKNTSMTKRIAQLELAALQSQMNPHFIFNSLGAIQYFIQTKRTEKADEYLSDFALLMRKILDSSKSRYISIVDEIKLLDIYLGLEKVRFSDNFDYEIVLDPSIEKEAPLPPMIIQPFVENAINHGVYHLKDRKGFISIRFEKMDNALVRVVVEDNGIGREAALKYRRKNHKSHGMQIVKERMENYNLAAKLNYVSFEIEDLVARDEQITGTRVTLIFKNKQIL